jgi:hypothetical protein
VYVGLVALLLPAPPEQTGPQLAGFSPAERAVPPEDMFTAAVSAVDDLSSFCIRQPQVCETAHAVFVKLEAKAKYSFRLMYEWAQQPPGERGAGEPPLGLRADPMPTGSLTKIAAGSESQSTLTIEDLIPEWRGPKDKRAG